MKANTPYRYNCVYSVWKISILSEIIVDEENAWQFEKNGEERTARLDGFYSSNINNFVISNTIVTGRWVKRELIKIRKEIPNLEIKRKINSTLQDISLCIKELLFQSFFRYTPYILQSSIHKLLRRRV